MIQDLQVEETLPFSQPKQEALLGHLLTDSKFFLVARPRIKKEWWALKRLGEIWELMTELSERHKRPLTAAELGSCPRLMVMDLADQNSIRSTMSLCIQRRADFGLDILQEDLTSWFQTRIYLTYMKKSEYVFNRAASGGGKDKDGIQEAFRLLKEMNREIDEAQFEPGVVEKLKLEDISEAQLSALDAVSFGLPKLDAFMNPESVVEGIGTGGLLKGDMTILLAPSNTGKTTAMITVVCVNLLLEKDILLVTHEGRLGDLKMKLWQSIMESTRKELIAGLSVKEYVDKLKEQEKAFEKHLEFMPLNKAGLTVEDVDVAIRRRQEKWRDTHLGKGFDLVVDDYAAKLTTQQARGGQLALRHIHEIVYNYFSQIALEHNVHVLTAIQTNREGSKLNSRTSKDAESRFLTMEDVMESWGPMTTATNVISLNRPPKAQARHITGFYLAKSRSSETGVVFLAESQFSVTRSHWPTWECQEYKLGSPNGDRVEKLLEDFGGLDEESARVEDAAAR